MKNRVLIIVENSPVNFDPRVWKEATTLENNGYAVSVLCPRGNKAEPRHEVVDRVHVFRHPMPDESGGPVGYLCEYTAALFWEWIYSCWIYLTRGFDIIQGCSPPDNLFLIALPFKLLGVKYIFDHHDASPELYVAKYGKKTVLYKVLVLCERLTYMFSDVIIATNESYKNLAVTRGGHKHQDVFVVRNGPDLATFTPVAPNVSLKHGKTYLVAYVGNMGFQDGLDILLEAALHIKNSGRTDVHFTCVGKGPALSELRKMVAEKNLSDTVTFTGRLPDKDMLEILSTADVCVNPDRPCEMNNISTMIKIMEYMALGKPIVQFDMKEGRVSARDASLYADTVNQVPDFAAKIMWLLDRPCERERMGKLGRERVERALAWKHSVKQLLQAYERALTKRKDRKTAGARAFDIDNSMSDLGQQ